MKKNDESQKYRMLVLFSYPIAIVINIILSFIFQLFSSILFYHKTFNILEDIESVKLIMLSIIIFSIISILLQTHESP